VRFALSELLKTWDAKPLRRKMRQVIAIDSQELQRLGEELS
jgi:hypothetical protein